MLQVFANVRKEKAAGWLCPYMQARPRGGSLDRSLQVPLGRFTAANSPAGLAPTYTRWAQRFVQSANRQLEIALKAQRKWTGHLNCCLKACVDPRCPEHIDPLPQNKSIATAETQHRRHRFLYPVFLLSQRLCLNATTGVPGASNFLGELVAFVGRQLPNKVSSSSFPAIHAEVLKVSPGNSGRHLVHGAANFMEAWRSVVLGGGLGGAEAAMPRRALGFARSADLILCPRVRTPIDSFEFGQCRAASSVGIHEARQSLYETPNEIGQPQRRP